MTTLLLALSYLTFVSLGLPDSLLGSAWPAMYPALRVPVSYAGIVSLIISAGTVTASLLTDWLVRALGTGRLVALSVALTAIGLLGFSCSATFALLCLWAIPYGLGAGAVDATLNNYAALHFSSRHVSWLHCMWGVGASTGPLVMGVALSSGGGWKGGYLWVGLLQCAVCGMLVASSKAWRSAPASTNQSRAPLRLADVARTREALAAMLFFFLYLSFEATAGLWASSYLALSRGVDADVAAAFASFFYVGMTAGRAGSGFATMRLGDRQIVILGFGIISCGLALLLLPLPNTAALLGLVILGVGCAPVFPGMIKLAPALVGSEQSQAVIGLQMACGSAACALTPLVFGALAGRVGTGSYPWFLASFVVLAIATFCGMWRHKARA